MTVENTIGCRVWKNAVMVTAGLIAGSMLWCDVCSAQSAGDRDKPAIDGPQRVAAEHLPNAYRLHPKVISGGQPAGEAGFRELQALGVKTIVSVDGAKPDVELAKKYGLRYVHLPHGYDGVPEQRGKELAKAVRDLPGPVYVHCHHGKHRSPAAAVVACVEVGYLPKSAAVNVLQVAGTSPSYRGLYQSVRAADRIDPRELDELRVEFREVMPLPPMAEAMVAIEHTHDHLKKLAENRWQSLPAHPDLRPAHEALLLMEHYTELARTDAVKGQVASFRALLSEATDVARQLEQRLRAGELRQANTLFERVTQHCTACHRQYRDVPLGEKVK